MADNKPPARTRDHWQVVINYPDADSTMHCMTDAYAIYTSWGGMRHAIDFRDTIKERSIEMQCGSGTITMTALQSVKSPNSEYKGITTMEEVI
jgi:hypothetical protein